MSKKEIIAYAITHAPKGVKGGPYEAIGGDMGDTCERLSASLRWPVDNPVNTAEEVLEEAREFLAEEIAPKVPHARVIRIVRKARPFKETIPVCGTCGYDAHGGRDESEPAPSPSEASAVEVLRELVAWGARCDLDMDDVLPIADRARRVLAASGPDPMPVVRAAMAEEDARVRMVRASYAELRSLEGDWLRCAEATRVAVEAYRKAGGK